MPDLETRMPELLRRAAGGAPPDERLARRVLRRARRRRVLNASAAGLVVVVLVAGTLAGVRVVLRSDGATIADETPTPSPSASAVDPHLPEAVWPEVTLGGLAAAQASVDDGHQPWRLDPEQTAAAFAVNVLDWSPEDVQARRLPGPDAAVSVVVSNRGLGPGAGSAGPPAPETVIRLDQFGRTGEDGVWSVAAADSAHIELDALDPGESRLSGRLVDTIPEWAPGVWFVVEGEHTPNVLDLLGPDGEGTISPQETFEVEIPADVAPAGSVVGVVVFLWDPEGTLVTAEAFPYVVPGATSSGPTDASTPIDALPSAVLATRDAIAIAAEARDYQALEALIDPDRFAYNFDDGSNPVPLWREDPAVLDTLAAILQMPFTTNREAYPDVDEASPTVYIWPSLMASDLEDLSAEERAMLEALGISDREVRDMLEAFGGYVGPRTGIAEDGTWLFYATGGD